MQIADRLARWVISVSGLAVICAVLGIGVFLFLEVLPLLRGARLFAPAAYDTGLAGAPVFLAVDEHQEQALVLGEAPEVRVIALKASAAAPPALPLAGLAGQEVTAAAPVLRAPALALGTAQGEVWLGEAAVETAFEGRTRVVRPRVTTEAVFAAVPGYRITALAYRREGGRGLVAAIADHRYVVVSRLAVHAPLAGPARRALDSLALSMEAFGPPTQIAINGSADQVLVGTATGFLTRWRVPAEGEARLLEQVRAVPGGAITSLAYLLGDRSLAVGGADGSVATWSLVREETAADGWRLTRIHPLPAHPAAVVAIAPSPRDKGFLTVSSDGAARLQYMTTERVLAQWAVGAAPGLSIIAPKTNGALVADAQGRLHHWQVDNPHPDISWRALFGKIWYEGYERPDYIWQSTGGTDDFESKYSLVPLIFGTLKGTCYALLFAVPLALFGALYCSQFLDLRLRNPVKSTVELMAALPSVVLGFVAGVLMAPLVQHHLVAVLAMPLIVPAVGVLGMSGLYALPGAAVRGLVRRHEFWLLLACVAAGVCVAGAAGPGLERLLFAGDFEAWLLRTTGTRFDQRNALVVGWAMGFAVVPIIFTICEDAFSSVPKQLVGASLACGASPWQTAWRVVLPAAGSGVFSAVMVGFGRAIGETMIVLMATGNTPVMDWSLFNGFRALSANIAVEIPEAPHGGTLYRVLFVAALLLFAMTFVVNTAAEMIRLRLRRQLQGI